MKKQIKIPTNFCVKMVIFSFTDFSIINFCIEYILEYYFVTEDNWVFMVLNLTPGIWLTFAPAYIISGSIIIPIKVLYNRKF